MNKKGFSLVELTISLILVALVLFSMMNLLVSIKDFDVEVSDYNNNIVSQQMIVKAINNDIIQNGLTSIGTYDSTNKNISLTVGGTTKYIQLINDGKTVIYYSNKNTPILSETLCSTCGRFTNISTNKAGNVNTGEVVKIIIEHLNSDFNCEITYYKAN